MDIIYRNALDISLALSKLIEDNPVKAQPAIYEDSLRTWFTSRIKSMYVIDNGYEKVLIDLVNERFEQMKNEKMKSGKKMVKRKTIIDSSYFEMEFKDLVEKIDDLRSFVPSHAKGTIQILQYRENESELDCIEFEWEEEETDDEYKTRIGISNMTAEEKRTVYEMLKKELGQ